MKLLRTGFVSFLLGTSTSGPGWWKRKRIEEVEFLKSCAFSLYKLHCIVTFPEPLCRFGTFTHSFFCLFIHQTFIESLLYPRHWGNNDDKAHPSSQPGWGILYVNNTDGYNWRYVQGWRGHLVQTWGLLVTLRVLFAQRVRGYSGHVTALARARKHLIWRDPSDYTVVFLNPRPHSL